mgnify:FL=1
MIYAAKGAGAIAAKLYPVGMTTNSDDGISDILAMYPVFAAMERAGMVLCLHGEKPGVFTLDREGAFIPSLCEIVDAFPGLKIVLEHITTAESVRLIARMPATVAATITVHHLYLTLDDVIGGMLRPHAFCKPIAKRPEDRANLILAATSGDPKFFLGTDSAPHLCGKKECDGGCAGVWVPHAMEALTAKFEEHGKLDRLGDFTSRFGAEHYGQPLNQGFLEMRREPEPWIVPDEISGIVPFLAGQKLNWRIVES